MNQYDPISGRTSHNATADALKRQQSGFLRGRGTPKREGLLRVRQMGASPGKRALCRQLRTLIRVTYDANKNESFIIWIQMRVKMLFSAQKMRLRFTVSKPTRKNVYY
jgi:hypothetical protein